MDLKFVRVGHEFRDSKELDQIMMRQFPPEEYMSLDKQLELQDSGDIEVWGLYDSKDLIGFTTLLITDKMVYLFFLAFDDDYQGKGYGSHVMRRIAESYEDRAATVDFELIDEKAENNRQRIKRRNFYLKNGFFETGWSLAYLGAQHEIFCMNKPFQIGIFKEMLNKLPINNFSPQYFRVQMNF